MKNSSLPFSRKLTLLGLLAMAGALRPHGLAYAPLGGIVGLHRPRLRAVDKGSRMVSDARWIPLPPVARRAIGLWRRETEALIDPGRGIGLLNKMRAYRLQEAGADTVQANEQLGFKPDQRSYELVAPMLRQFGVQALRLMTNNPRKIAAMEKLDMPVAERVPLLVNRNAHNNSYLNTKQAKLGHMMAPLTSVEQGEPVAPAAVTPFA